MNTHRIYTVNKEYVAVVHHVCAYIISQMPTHQVSNERGDTVTKTYTVLSAINTVYCREGEEVCVCACTCGYNSM